MTSRTKALRTLDTVLRPQSVAIIGLSRTALNSPVSILRTLMDFGYQGRIYIVNPKMSAGKRDGYTVCKTLEDIPESPDLAVVSVARDYVLSVLQSCAEKNIRAAIVITQGFADADAHGVRLQKEMATLSSQNGIRILGPNTIGVSDAFSGFTSSFIEVYKDYVPVGLVSQSGLFMMGHLIINNEPAGFCMSVDVGNACDISIAEVLEYYADVPAIRVIQCHLEGIEDGAEFVKIASRVTRKKPIILLKAGKSRTGQKAVLSHSGSATGENEIYQAAFLKAGIITADDAEELRSLSKAFATYPLPEGNRVAVVSFSGGGAILAIDAVEAAGLTMATLSTATVTELQEFFPAWMEVENPVDVWIPVSRDFHMAFPRILDLVLRDEQVDAVLCIYCSYTLPKYADYDSSLYIGKAAQDHPRKPVLCWSYGMDISGFSKRVEGQGNVMVFRSLDEATTSLRELYRYGKTRRGKERGQKVPDLETCVAGTAAILARAKRTKRSYLFTEALEILNAYGMNVVDWRQVAGSADLQPVAGELDFPVCMKVISKNIIHKSDSGGVILDIHSAEELSESFKRLKDNVRRHQPSAEIAGALIQKMAPEGKEIILGAKRDPVFGPCIIVGAGGIYTEVFKDFAFRLAPVTEDDAFEMISELKFGKILDGVRGEPPCNVQSIADAVVRLSRLMCTHSEISEIDINPLIVNDRDAAVVDARIIL